MDNPAKWQDYFGTDLPDSMFGYSESVFHGMAGDDYFFSVFNQYDQIFIGGSGSDTYRIENSGVMTIADAGNSENDVIFASGIGIGLSSSYSLTVDNRHLVVFDIVSGQSIVAIDWQSPLHKIEKVVLSDVTLSYDDVANVIYSLDNYLGDYSWEEIPIPSFGADSALMNSTIEFYTYLYTETSAPPAPSVNTIAVDNILTMDELNVFSGISGSAETEAEVAAVVVDPNGNSSTFTATANSSTGAWSIAAVDILGSEIGSSDDGRYELSVTAMDFAGNTSEATSAYFLIDTAAPTIESVVEKLPNPLTLNASILGTDNSDDPLFGTSSSDVIYGLDGDDAIIGLEGDDKIIISDGSNGISGDHGSDQFIILNNYGLAVDNPSTQTGYFGAQLLDFSISEDVIVVNTDLNLKYVEEVYASNVPAEEVWGMDSVIENALPDDENRIVFFTGQHFDETDGFLYFHTPDDPNIDGSYLVLDKVTTAPTIDNFLSGTVTVNTDNVPVVSLQDWIISQYTSYGSLRLEFSNYAALDGGHGVLINSTDTDITLPDGKVIPADKIVYNDETADLQSIYDAVPSVVDIRIFGSSGNDYIDLSQGPFDAAKLFWSEGQDYLKGNDQTQLRLVSHDGALTINLSDEPLIIESGNNRTEFGSQVLQVIGTAFDDVLIGNELDNRFSWFGNNGDNKVTGGAGQDTFEFEIPEIFSTDTIGTITITDYESGEKIWFTDSNSLTADSFTATYMAGSDQTAIQMTLDGNTYTPVYVTGEFNVDDINVTPKNWYELTLIEEAPPTFTLPKIEAVSADWGSVLSTAEDDIDGTVNITTNSVEDGQMVTVTLNGQSYTASVSNDGALVTIPAADLQALIGGYSYSLSVELSNPDGNLVQAATVNFAVARPEDNSGSKDIIYTPGADNFQVNTYTLNEQNLPTVAGISDDGFVIIWKSHGQDSNGVGIYGQRYDSIGNLAGSEFKINSIDVALVGPAVTDLSNGGFVVVWTTNNQDGSDKGVYGQRYDSNGSVVGPEFQVNTYWNDWQGNASVTNLNDGGFIVTWASNHQDGSSNGIYGQRYDSSGNTVGPEFLVNTHKADSQEDSWVTGLKDGGFVAIWTSNNQDGSYRGIYGQRYDGSGHTTGAEFQVNTNIENDQKNPAVTSLSDGGFVVTWESNHGDNSEIYGQRYDSVGNKASFEFLINSTEAGFQIKPSVTSLKDGGFVVTWTSNQGPGPNWDIYGRLYDTNGNSVGAEFQVNNGPGYQGDSSVDDLNDGGFIITWLSYEVTDGVDGNVYGQRFDANGNMVQRIVELIDTAAPTIESVVTDWGSFVDASESDSDGKVNITTSGAEDGQMVTVTLNGQSYTASVSNDGALVTIPAADLQALTGGSSYSLSSDVSDAAGNAAEQYITPEFEVAITLPEILDVVFGPAAFPKSEFSASFALDTGWADYSVASEGTYVAHDVPLNDGQVITTETLRLWTGDVGTVSNATHLYIEKGTDERIGWLSGYAIIQIRELGLKLRIQQFCQARINQMELGLPTWSMILMIAVLEWTLRGSAPTF